MYKDKEKQKEYNKERMRKARLGSTEGSTKQGSTEDVYPVGVLPCVMTQDQADRFPNIPLPFGPAYYKALKEQGKEE